MCRFEMLCLPSRSRLSAQGVAALGAAHRCLQSRDLPHVMAAVDEVKLPPLLCRQRTQDRMVEDLDARAIALFALRDDLAHGCDLRADISDDFFRGHAPG